jgi:integrase
MTEKVIENFLMKYDKESTRFGYASALYNFFSIIYNFNRASPRVSPAEKQHFELLASNYLSEDRDYKQDIMDYTKKCKKPTKTIKMYVSVVVEFLRINSIKKVKLDYDDKKDIRRKTPQRYEVSKDKELTIDVIRTIMTHADVRIQSLILVLLTSGLRLSEALSIQISDYEKIEDGYGRLKLTWLYAKTGREIYSLITPECVNTLDQWLKVREKYINEKCINEELRVDDGRIFPFSKNVATISLKNILTTSKLTDGHNGDKLPYHYHQFRSYFSSQMKLVVHHEIVEYLIGGHSSDINALYRKYSFRQVLDSYKTASDVLSVSTDPVLKKKYSDAVSKINTLEQKQGINSDNLNVLITTIHDLQTDNRELYKRIENMENDWNSLRKVIATLYGKKLILEDGVVFKTE